MEVVFHGLNVQLAECISHLKVYNNRPAKTKPPTMLLPRPKTLAPSVEITARVLEVVGISELEEEEDVRMEEKLDGATEEVKDGSSEEEVNGSVEELLGSTEELLGSTEELLGSAEELLGSAEELLGSAEAVSYTHLDVYKRQG